MTEHKDRLDGYWIEKNIPEEDPLFRRRFYCSVCSDWNTYGKTKFCPECGARMVGDKDDRHTD